MRLSGITFTPECSTSAPCAPHVAPSRRHSSELRRPCLTSRRCSSESYRPQGPLAPTAATGKLPTSSEAGSGPSADALANAALEGPAAGTPHGAWPSSHGQAAARSTLTRGSYGTLAEELMSQTQSVDFDLFGGGPLAAAVAAVSASAAASMTLPQKQPKAAAAAAPAPTSGPSPSGEAMRLSEQEAWLAALTSSTPPLGSVKETPRHAAAVEEAWQRRCTARIKASLTLTDLKTALSATAAGADGAAAPSHAGGMDAICISVAFGHLPKLLRGRRLTDAEKRDVSAMLAAHMLPAALAAVQAGQLDTRGLTNVAVGIAKLEGLGGAEAAAVVRLLVECCQPQLARFTPQGLSNLMWALATLEVQPSGAWLSDFYSAVEVSLPLFNGQDVSNTLWGLGRFDLMPEVELLEALLARSLAQLGGPGCGRDASTAITCVARYYCKYNYKLRDEWAQAFMVVVQKHMHGYAPSDLVTVVHSLVCCNVTPPYAWMVTFYDVLKDRLIFDPTLGYNEYSRLLGSLSRVDYAPTQAWLQDFVAITAPKLSHLRYRALSELVWALACWNCNEISKEWLQGFLEVSTARMDDFRPRQLAIVMVALSHLNCKVPSAWLDRVLKHFVKHISEVKAHDLVDVLQSVGICEDATWLAKQSTTFHLLADTAASQFGVFDAGMHARLVVALARVKWFSPSAKWLVGQQAALLRCMTLGEPVDVKGTAGLRKAYASWNFKVDSRLEEQMLRGAAAAAAAGDV